MYSQRESASTREKKNDTNEDERSEVIPDNDQPDIRQSEVNLEIEVIDDTQKRNAEANQTPENEQMEINDENDGQNLELEPESPSSKKSVMVYEAWKKYMSLRTQGCDTQTILHNDV